MCTGPKITASISNRLRLPKSCRIPLPCRRLVCQPASRSNSLDKIKCRRFQAMSVDDDVYEEQLNHAIALSIQDQARTNEKVMCQSNRTNNPTPNPFLQDRKAMEEARLARLATKRSRGLHDGDYGVEGVDMPARKRATMASKEPSAAGVSVPFPEGVVKRTWVQGYSRSSDDIKIEEILQKDQLKLALLSSFQWSEPWLLTKIDVSRTKVILAAFAADELQLQILKFDDYLRIVIPTGNLVPHDWGETGVLENGSHILAITRFHHVLTEWLTDGVPHRLTAPDIGGSAFELGYAGLGKAVAALGLATSEPVQVDVACASLGAIKNDLVQGIYHACQGYVDETTQPESSLAGRDKPTKNVVDMQQVFRIYFPSHDTVAKSRGGTRAAGTICFQEKWWRATTFPSELMRDCVNTRDGLLMHSKIILVHCNGSTVNDRVAKPTWAYVGSANLSESAWGRIVKDKATGRPKILCRNWECGVIIPVRTAPASAETGQPTNLDMFKGVVPVPMKTPGPRYSKNTRPWFFLHA
ncbi:hypothetical protein UVI_02022500 [Ustilaginoidea virens]|uniref:PLD phosphodiesterase domain-containing protein n=1 Tax=Ustilaginoidea virens TaxID=1159556 RepID=A0A1B5L7H3_USTVR|nr:hypothetical protein UVI_02022500 [Ustilaginoidea virens]